MDDYALRRALDEAMAVEGEGGLIQAVAGALDRLADEQDGDEAAAEAFRRTAARLRGPSEDEGLDSRLRRLEGELNEVAGAAWGEGSKVVVNTHAGVLTYHDPAHPPLTRRLRFEGR